MKVIPTLVAMSLLLASNVAPAAKFDSCNTEQCVSYFEKFKKAARQGFVSAEYNTAKFYYYGYGTEQNDEQALKYYRKAAVKGIKEAQYMTGLLYVTHPELNEIEQGLYWLERAALNGHKHAGFLLGKSLAANIDGNKDYQEADKWLVESLERNYYKMPELIEQLVSIGVFTEQNFPQMHNHLIEQNQFIVKGKLTNFEPVQYERITVTGSTLESGFDTLLKNFRGRNSTTGSRIGEDCALTGACQRKSLNEMKDSIWVRQGQ
ncbi:tetratricopeptide repeat protein [Colwellia sp. MEBiC06753]